MRVIQNNNRVNRKVVNTKVKRKFNHYLNVDEIITGQSLHEIIKKYPYRNWVAELSETSPQCSNPAKERMNWVQKTLKTIGVKFTTKHTSSGSTITVVNCIDQIDEPTLVIPVQLHNEHREPFGTLNFANSIVQLILLSKNLQTTKIYVNVQLLFVSAKEPATWIDEVHNFLLTRHIQMTIGSILVPFYITGINPFIFREDWALSGEVYDCWLESEGLDPSLYCNPDFLGENYVQLKGDCYNGLSLSTALIAFGDMEVAEEEDEIFFTEIPKKQIEFSKRREFLKVQSLLFDLSITLSKQYSVCRLDTEFIH